MSGPPNERSTRAPNRSAISRSRDYLHGLMEEAERAARRMINELGAELADSFWEYLET